jgi:PmbA protein
MTEKPEYLDLARWAVEQAKQAGADGAEALIADSESVQISISSKQVEQFNAVRDAGIGVRILKDQKMAFGSSNDLSRESVKKLVTDLAAKVPYHTPDEFNVLAGPDGGGGTAPWNLQADAIVYDPGTASAPVEDKIRKAIRLETSGLEVSPKVKGAMSGAYQDQTSFVYLANSNGVSGWYPSSGCAGYVEFSATDGGDQQSGSHFKTVSRYADLNPDEIGRTAAANAVEMLGAKPIPSTDVPLVITPEVGTQLLTFVVGLLSADEVQKGRSKFAGKIGTQVAASRVTLVDDGRLKGGISTAPVDGEGVATQETPLIVDGVLKTYLYDSYTAKKGKTKSTGNRARGGGYQSAGGIGPTNLYLKAGDAKPEAIVAGIPRGFFLKIAFGMFAAIDGASGDFSFPAAGLMIEKGRPTYPVRGISIAGNLFELLKSIDKVGSDLTWFNNVGCPTLLVKSVKIGGSGAK